MKPAARKFARAWIDSTPILGDLIDHHVTFKRRRTAVRGVFKTREEAVGAIPPGLPRGYDQPDILADEDVAALTATRELGRLADRDYPALFWLSQVAAPQSRVFNIGGNVGVEYYAFRSFLPIVDKVQWTICEIPSIVARGLAIARERNEQNLFFSTDLATGNGADILLCAGTMQYLDRGLSEIIADYPRRPKHVIINTTPARRGPAFWTIQNVGYAFVPYRVFSIGELEANFAAIGYTLVDTWPFPRALRVPFHRDHAVTHYHGFYFRLGP